MDHVLVGTRLLIKRDEPSSKAEEGGVIEIPDDLRNKIPPNTGTVVAFGNEVGVSGNTRFHVPSRKAGFRGAVILDIGSRVMIHGHAGIDVKIDGQPLTIIDEEDIILVFHPKSGGCCGRRNDEYKGESCS